MNPRPSARVSADWPAALPPLLAAGDDWLAIDKPAGLAVHPGPRTLDCLEARLAATRLRARPAHRIDRDTSGVLLLGRNSAGHARLSAAFAARAVTKAYLAIIDVTGDLAPEGLIEAALAKQSSARAGWRMVVARSGTPARTRWRLLGRSGPHALILMLPETGRTHQLRVHAGLLAQGAAIVGDPVYGRADPRGLMLHAWALDFPDGAGRRVRVEAPLPARFLALGLPLPDLEAAR